MGGRGPGGPDVRAGRAGGRPGHRLQATALRLEAGPYQALNIQRLIVKFSFIDSFRFYSITEMFQKVLFSVCVCTTHYRPKVDPSEPLFLRRFFSYLVFFRIIRETEY